MTFLLIIIFVSIILYDVPILIRNRYWRDLMVFSVLLAVAFIMSLFYILEIPVFSPYRAIVFLVKDILHLYYK